MSSGPDARHAERAAAVLRGALPVRTRRCVLREVRASDAEAVHAYRGEAVSIRFLGHQALNRTQVGELVGEWVATRDAVTMVAELGGRVVGDVRLRFRPCAAMAPATTSAVEAALGYVFHPEVQGQGLATECVREVVDLAQQRPAGVRRLTARVFAPAVRSSRLLQRIGFTRDGIDRQAVRSPDGEQWWDDELWSLLAGEGAQ